MVLHIGTSGPAKQGRGRSVRACPSALLADVVAGLLSGLFWDTPSPGCAFGAARAHFHGVRWIDSRGLGKEDLGMGHPCLAWSAAVLATLFEANVATLMEVARLNIRASYARSRA